VSSFLGQKTTLGKTKCADLVLPQEGWFSCGLFLVLPQEDRFSGGFYFFAVLVLPHCKCNKNYINKMIFYIYYFCFFIFVHCFILFYFFIFILRLRIELINCIELINSNKGN
jgi:hypothetical protein